MDGNKYKSRRGRKIEKPTVDEIEIKESQPEPKKDIEDVRFRVSGTLIFPDGNSVRGNRDNKRVVRVTNPEHIKYLDENGYKRA